MQRKYQKLKSEYKKIKGSNSKTGRQRKAWKFSNCMNEILGDRPATQTAIVIDALQEVEQSDESFNDKARDVEVTDAVGDDAKMVKKNASGDFVVEDTDEKVLEGDAEVKQQMKNKTEVNMERQKNRTREDKFEKATSMIADKVSKANKRVMRCL